MFQQLGIIIIGRNEGERLRRALRSVPSGLAAMLYVDSGSTDGSPQLARSLGFAVHELDPAQPFSAARARYEGAEVVIKAHPEVKRIQFLDGDSILEPNWLARATEYLDTHHDTGIVCGLLTEQSPQHSFYNRLMSLHWNNSTGEIDSCGGIFMVRLSVYKAAGGFNSRLLTGEEAEFCSRVQALGNRIIRLEEAMARHDANLVRFRDWWSRAIWGGFGDALEFDVLKGRVRPQRLRQTRSSFLWAIGIPSVALFGFIGMVWSVWFVVLPVLSFIGYFALIFRIMRDRVQRGDPTVDALIYSLFCVLRKLPVAIGFLRYWIVLGSRVRHHDENTTRLPGREK